MSPALHRNASTGVAEKLEVLSTLSTIEEVVSTVKCCQRPLDLTETEQHFQLGASLGSKCKMFWKLTHALRDSLICPTYITAALQQSSSRRRPHLTMLGYELLFRTYSLFVSVIKIILQILNYLRDLSNL